MSRASCRYQLGKEWTSSQKQQLVSLGLSTLLEITPDQAPRVLDRAVQMAMEERLEGDDVWGNSLIHREYTPEEGECYSEVNQAFCAKEIPGSGGNQSESGRLIDEFDDLILI